MAPEKRKCQGTTGTGRVKVSINPQFLSISRDCDGGSVYSQAHSFLDKYVLVIQISD